MKAYIAYDMNKRPFVKIEGNVPQTNKGIANYIAALALDQLVRQDGRIYYVWGDCNGMSLKGMRDLSLFDAALRKSPYNTLMACYSNTASPDVFYPQSLVKAIMDGDGWVSYPESFYTLPLLEAMPQVCGAMKFEFKWFPPFQDAGEEETQIITVSGRGVFQHWEECI